MARAGGTPSIEKKTRDCCHGDGDDGDVGDDGCVDADDDPGADVGDPDGSNPALIPTDPDMIPIDSALIPP